MNSNGNTIDREGRLITCEHGGRRVTRTELDGSITIIADKYNGKRLNSPNDAVVTSDGAIWFTRSRSTASAASTRASKPSPSRRSITSTGSIRNPVTSKSSSMTSWSPMAFAFSPDEKKLYVCDTGFTDGPDNPSHIRVFDLDVAAGKASNSKVFADMPKPSITDGVRCDTEGRVWCSVGWGDPNEDGVRCYTPTAICSEKSTYRKPSPICASAVSNETNFTSAVRHRSTPSIRVCRARMKP